MSIEDFVTRVVKVIDMVSHMYNHTESPIMKKFCSEILETLNISIDDIKNKE
jgi:hypothetical protein